jgi:regulator of replication initiation timing
MAKQPKLKTLLEDIFNEQPQVNKYEVVEGVKSFSIVGKSLYNNSNIMEIAKQVSQIAENAHSHVLSETNDWFDQVSVNKNMQSLKKRVAEFKKAAGEAHQLNQRMTGLYEDMGHILNRYYDITEDAGDMDNDGIQEPDDEEYMDNKDKAIKKAMNKEALDTDKTATGGGDEDDYAAKDGEAMNETSPGHRTGGQNDPESEDDGGKQMQERKSLKDVGGVVGVPALGQYARKFADK